MSIQKLSPIEKALKDRDDWRANAKEHQDKYVQINTELQFVKDLAKSKLSEADDLIALYERKLKYAKTVIKQLEPDCEQKHPMLFDEGKIF